MKVRVCESPSKKIKMFFFSSRKVSEDAWVERFSANQRFRSFQFFVVAIFFRTSSDSKPPKRCWKNSHNIAFSNSGNKLILKHLATKTWDATSRTSCKEGLYDSWDEGSILELQWSQSWWPRHSSTGALLSRLWQKCNIWSNLIGVCMSYDGGQYHWNLFTTM